MSGTSLIVAALTAPIVGIDRARKTVHAIDLKHVGDLWLRESRRVTTEAVCGERVRAFGSKVDGEVMVVPWPPAVNGLPWVRCKPCFDGTGRRRPRSQMSSKAPS